MHQIQDLSTHIARVKRAYMACKSIPILRLLLLDVTLVNIGAGFSMVAMPFLIIGATGKALDFGIISLIEALPSLIVMLFFPNFLNKWNPVWLLIICRIWFVVINLMIAAVAYFQIVSLPVMMSIALVSGIVWAVSYPCSQCMTPLVLKRKLITLANAINSSISGTVIAAVSIVTGYLIFQIDSHLSIAAAFVIDSLFLIFSFVTLKRLFNRIKSAEIASEQSEKLTTMNSQWLIKKSSITGPILLVITLVVFPFVIIFGPILTYVTLIVVQMDSQQNILLFSCQLLGAYMAAITATPQVSASLKQLVQRQMVLWIACASCLILISVIPVFAVRWAMFTVLFFCSLKSGIEVLTWLQSSISASKRNMALTYYASVGSVSGPVAAVLVGASSDQLGVNNVLQVNAILTIAFTLVIFGIFKYRPDNFDLRDKL